MKTLVFGAGNLLLSDEGFGVHFVRYLEQHYVFPDEVELLDAGTGGLMLSHKLEESDRVYIIDALDMEGQPGTWRRYELDQFARRAFPTRLSPHQVGLQEMLLVSQLRGRCPNQVRLWGIIPASLAPGTELSPALQEGLREMAAAFTEELRQAGLGIMQRQVPFE